MNKFIIKSQSLVARNLTRIQPIQPCNHAFNRSSEVTHSTSQANQSTSHLKHTQITCVSEQLSRHSRHCASIPFSQAYQPHCSIKFPWPPSTRPKPYSQTIPTTDVFASGPITPLTGHRQHVSSPHPFGTPASQAFTRTAVNTSQVRSPPIDPGLNFDR